MLNEIFKGMDNAAEKINENFEDLWVETGSNDDGYWFTLPGGLTIMCAQKTITVSSATAGQEVLVTQDFPLQLNSDLPLFMAESGALFAEGSTSSFMTTIKRGGQAFASSYGRSNRWEVYMSHENSGSSANRVRFFGLAIGYKE